MDYLFYGTTTTTRKTDATTVMLNIHCSQDETLNIYELSPDTSNHLAYNQVHVTRDTDNLAATFDVRDDQVFLFIISGQSNEIDIPFEVTYAVYNGEIISLPENNIIELQGTTHVSPDGKRGIIG